MEVLRQVEAGEKVAEICRKVGISEATYYAWKKQYAGLGVSELCELPQLRDENGRLKRLVADLSLVLHRLGKEKASISMGRALQSLLIESLKCAKPTSNQGNRTVEGQNL